MISYVEKVRQGVFSDSKEIMSKSCSGSPMTKESRISDCVKCYWQMQCIETRILVIEFSTEEILELLYNLRKSL